MRLANAPVVRISLACVFVGALTDTLVGQEAAPERLSSFGRYEGYSIASFDGWDTTSRYLEMRDGVLLAIDITRPTLNGEPAAEPLPVVWTHSRYHRNPSALMRMFGGGRDAEDIESMVDVQGDLQRLVRHGYVVAAVGVRGSGASFGRCEGLFTESETKDAVEVIEWLAAQPWCDGNVGMFGGSYLGITQYMAASKAPPALKAIFPNVAALDLYDVIHPGGVFREDMMRHWDQLTKQLDTTLDAPLVDGDEDGAMMAKARTEHADNWSTLEEYGKARYRDHDSPSLAYSHHGPSGRLDDIIAAQVPAYHFNAWYDIFVTDAVLWYANYTGPQKLAIGAWSHGGMPDPQLMNERQRLTSIEQHRWFDYWLKGIDNGIMDEPPIHYAVMTDPGEWTWETADAWPPPNTITARLYFFAGPLERKMLSLNDGRLVAGPSEGKNEHDAYTVDPSTTTGSATRWDNAVGAAPVMVYPDLAPTDARSLTYTTPALEYDVTVTGHPVVTLYVTSTGEDAIFHVLLEEVYDTGESRYVTEGVVRGSLRALGEAPWNNLGLPFQRCYEEDRNPLPAEKPTKIVMDLHPTATVFNAGNRIRVTIRCADADNLEAPPTNATEIRIHRDAEHASEIVLPIAN